MVFPHVGAQTPPVQPSPGHAVAVVAPVDYIDRMLRAIVGIEIPIDRLEGKRKLSQDEALTDRIGTVHGLMQEGWEESRLLGALVNEQILSSTP